MTENTFHNGRRTQFHITIFSNCMTAKRNKMYILFYICAKVDCVDLTWERFDIVWEMFWETDRQTEKLLCFRVSARTIGQFILVFSLHYIWCRFSLWLIRRNRCGVLNDCLRLVSATTEFPQSSAKFRTSRIIDEKVDRWVKGGKRVHQSHVDIKCVRVAPRG